MRICQRIEMEYENRDVFAIVTLRGLTIDIRTDSPCAASDMWHSVATACDIGREYTPTVMLAHEG